MNVIVGAGLAAVRAASALRDAGSSAPIVMIGAENILAYERPPLSKEFLRGESRLEDACLHGAEFFRDHDIELELGARATAVDVVERTVSLASGRRLRFEQLLVASGASPRRLGIPGEHLDGVLVLRTAEDALLLRSELARAERVVVLGAGLIGLEVAAVAHHLGKHVTLVEAGRHPLARLVDDDQVGSAVARLHRAHGTTVLTSTTATMLRGAGRVEEVVLSTGGHIRADVVLVAIGVAPDTAWLQGSGIRVDDGVLTDAELRTNVPGIFAAGDVARAFRPPTGRCERFESYGAAHEQGLAAGRAMAGAPAAPVIVPGAGSEQFGVRMNIVGVARDADSVVLRGSVEEGSFIALFLAEQRVRGAFVMNRPRELPALRKLVADGARLDEAAARDEGTPLVAARVMSST